MREYRQLRMELDRAVLAVGMLHSGQLRCAPGCASCCKAFSLLPLEAAVVEAAFRMLPENRQQEIVRTVRTTDACPFLKKGLCEVYEHRPFICRTQGLPIGYVDEERECIEVSACLLNFPEDSDIDPETLLFLDPFNARLREMNESFLRALGLPPDIPRIPMAAIAGGGLPESLFLAGK